ncbi:MAG: ROK family protein, partial [Anaerolineaceae bacterium]|nr:ROK family protein [Anaerolineaceae bacterium]
MSIYGAVEGGGTKFNCLVGTGPDDIRAEIRIPTTTPDETMRDVVAFFQAYEREHEERLAGIGVACFGPVDLNPASATFGSITTTPKEGWARTPIVPVLKEHFDVPIPFELDVNGAAIGEATWGAAVGLTDFAYYTIGTGIGAGVMVNGKMLHGLVHPEAGHMVVRRIAGDEFEGNCSYHGANCLEGMATGPAMMKRWGIPAEEMSPNHPAWELEAEYIAAAMQTTICCYSPQRIILGGGVMQQEHLFPLIRSKVQRNLNGYI